MHKMATTTRPPARLGVGIYSVAEAARLVGVQPGKVRRWIDPEVGIVKRQFPVEESTLSFLELVELHFIKMFRSGGMSLQAIRQAADVAGRKFRSDYPFAIRRFDTDGKTIFATLQSEETDRVVVEDVLKGQRVFEGIMRPFFLKLDYHKNREALRFWPRKKTGRIVLDPVRKFGKPIDDETGVQTCALYKAVLANEGNVAMVADWFDVPKKAVQAAVAFEESMATAT